MVIENRTVVSLNYRLTVNENGNEIEVEQTSTANPFVFLFGAHNVLPKFEENLAGKTIGDKFDFHLSAEDGYGIYDAKNVIEVPINAFHGPDGKPDEKILTLGNILTMNDQEGRTFQGKVKAVTIDHVEMDFNHPLAGQELHFTGEVVNVRLATLEELQHGHVHGAGGHHH